MSPCLVTGMDIPPLGSGPIEPAHTHSGCATNDLPTLTLDDMTGPGARGCDLNERAPPVRGWPIPVVFHQTPTPETRRHKPGDFNASPAPQSTNPLTSIRASICSPKEKSATTIRGETAVRLGSSATPTAIRPSVRR